MNDEDEDFPFCKLPGECNVSICKPCGKIHGQESESYSSYHERLTFEEALMKYSPFYV